MCGINGFIVNGKEERPILEAQIGAMNDSIIHRGPDDDGVFIDNSSDSAIAMGMRRLAIIDLDSGKQPIFNKNKQIVIVFNGEIYNYQRLRQNLIERGVTFETKSDTEVILKLYELEGEASFSKLDGMFAFSILDKSKNKLFIARDFFGEKPLYYTRTKNRFVWASELKSILKLIKEKPEICKTGLNHYLRLTYIPAPHTIYGNIHKLEANHYITYDLNSHDFLISPIDTPKESEEKGISFAKAINLPSSTLIVATIPEDNSYFPTNLFSFFAERVIICLSGSYSTPIFVNISIALVLPGCLSSDFLYILIADSLFPFVK